MFSAERTVAVPVMRQMDAYVDANGQSLHVMSAALAALAARLSSLVAQRERLELIRAAPDSTFGVLQELPDMREMLSLAFAQRCRALLDQTLLELRALQQQHEACEQASSDAVALMQQHVGTVDDVDVASARNDAAPSLVDKFEQLERSRRIATRVYAVCNEAVGTLTLDATFEQLLTAAERVDSAALAFDE